MPSPIQIILNPENFEEARKVQGGGPKRDFFANRDREFKRHKLRLVSQLETCASSLRKARFSDIGFVKVSLRREAWAKSHRPVGALLKFSRTPIVGGADLGEMICKARPSTLLEVAEDISRAEEQTRLRYLEYFGKEVPYPSNLRSESGAIESIELFRETDRREFSLNDALEWLSNPKTGGLYEVELFETPRQLGELDALDEGHRRLFKSFIVGLKEIGDGLSVDLLATSSREHPCLSVRISQSSAAPTIRLSSPQHSERRRDVSPFDSSEERHRRLLGFLESHPLVRKISLPGIILRPTGSLKRIRPESVNALKRNKANSHPKIGIVDGGLGAFLSDWVIYRWDLLAIPDMDPRHGSFIGGLAVLGKSLNGDDCCPESDGAELLDLALYQKEHSPAFETYFPNGPADFFDELEVAVN